MKTIRVEVRDDHLETLAKTRPMPALAELVWNALDAEATRITVTFIENPLGGVDRIEIRDNGHGLAYTDALAAFGNLGGSWKRASRRSATRQRLMHGKFGKGRFRAFSIGSRVIWRSRYDENGKILQFTIEGSAENPGQFTVSDPEPATEGATGMDVLIHNTLPAAEQLRGVKALEDATEQFAPYLYQYPDICIIYDGVPLDPSNAQTRVESYPLEKLVMESGERVEGTLDVVEWGRPGRKGVVFCDEGGFARETYLHRLTFRGFSYTAYLKSAHVERLDAEGSLGMGELHPDVRLILQECRNILRRHFNLREAEDAQHTLELWKRIGLYPYEGEPQSQKDLQERKVFDIYATHLYRMFDEFAEAPFRVQRVVLRMLQELSRRDAIETAKILDELIAAANAAQPSVPEHPAESSGAENA
ncbi:MAG TPA: ATP-binding protein [Candidatus Hydrogenedentes bacterium]|nr:ATP-binding protein [Candidatus Hydrogenedentota bacterium]